MRPIGLHVRITHSILDAVHQAIRLKIPIFQCFLINQKERRLITLTEEINTTLATMRNQFQRMYLHGSYWINLAGSATDNNRALLREIALAKQLGCSNLILHPGSAATIASHANRIKHLAQLLNRIIDREPDMLLILENTCHGNTTIGSNLEDFYELKQQLTNQTQIRFCIDTAHAHAYGYDLSTEKAQELFITLLDTTIGIDQIELIHLNDAAYPMGSHVDKHAALGHGCIGYEALKMFALHPRLATIPLILELPILPDGEEDAMLQQVKDWHQLL